MFRGLLEYQHCTIFLLFIPSQNLQDMDERRTVKLGETYRSFAEAERRVIPIVSKCLEGMVSAAKAVDERRVCSKREDGCTVKKKKVSWRNKLLLNILEAWREARGNVDVDMWIYFQLLGISSLSILLFLSSLHPRMHPLSWSRLSPVLILQATSPLRTLVRIWAERVQTGPSAAHRKEKEREKGPRGHDLTQNIWAEPRTSCGCLGRNQRYNHL